MITPVENWGQLKLVTTPADAAPTLQLLTLPKIREGADDEAAAAAEPFVARSIVRIPISTIASASGTTKNDLTLALRPGSLSTRTEHATVELSSIRFAIPNVCVGYEDGDEAGRVILHEVQEAMHRYESAQRQSLAAGSSSEESQMIRLATMGHALPTEGEADAAGCGAGHAGEETVVAVFDDTTVSYPAGKFKVVVSNHNVVLEDRKRGGGGALVVIPLSDIQQLYLCDVPASFAKSGGNPDEALGQYVVLILRNPVKIRTTLYAHVVISCPPYLVLDDEHPWRSELTTQEELNRVLQFIDVSHSAGNHADAHGTAVDYPLTPTLSGKVSEILIRVFKATAKVPAYGGVNKEYRSVLTQRRHCCLRCLYHSTEGLLYVVNGGFLFLHRPATKIGFGEMAYVEMDEAESGSATFQLAVYVRNTAASSSSSSNYAKGSGKANDKHVFSGIDKVEKEGLLHYLNKKVKLIRRGLTIDDSGDEEDDEDEDGGDGNEEDDDSNNSSSSDREDASDSDDDVGDADSEEEGVSRRRDKHKHRGSSGSGGRREKHSKEDGEDRQKEKRHHRHHHKRSRHSGEGDGNVGEERRHRKKRE